MACEAGEGGELMNYNHVSMAVTDGTDGTEGTVCPQRCTRTAAEYQHLDCTLPAPETWLYLSVGLIFFFSSIEVNMWHMSA